MKNFTTKYVHRLLFALFWCFLFQLSAVAQTGSYLSWNTQMGCITYDSSGNPNNPQQPMVFTEDIPNTTCIKVCELSNVIYTVHGNNIVNVQWTVGGGTIVTSGTGNSIGTVNWGSAGSGLIDVVITYPKNITRHISVCIEKINSPKANFKFYSDNGQNFCLDSPVNFQNLSLSNGGSDISNYIWDFGDGNSSTLFEPTHSYSQPGTYPVQLTVINNCGCSSTYSLNVIISNSPSATINYPAVVCQNNDVHTYTADSDCDGEWNIVGGTILNPTGTTVNVIWNNVGADGFGYVSYRSPCTCTAWTTIKIPVIKTVGTIEGNKNICLNDQGLFSLPQWPSTQFVWSLSGTSLNSIVATGQRNEILVDAVNPGQYTLSCHYTNTILGCSGDASMTITILKPIIISGASSLCSGTSNSYSSSAGSVLWVLKNGTTTVASSTAATFTNTFTAAGVYTLTATSASYCTGQKIITVEQTPTAPTGTISGETKVCAGQPYQYSFNNTDPNSIAVWSVTNGTILGANTGNAVTVVFNDSASNYTVTVQKRSTGSLGCLSPPLTLAVTKLVISPIITSGSGASTFCPSSQSTFTVNLGGISPDLIEWSISPAGLGNIVSGINSATVTVNWNEISGTQTTGTVNVRVKKCIADATKTFSVTLLQNPVLTLSAPASVCYGENINVSLSAPGITTGVVLWNFGNGITTTTPVNASGNYTLANPYNSGTTPTNINYVITASINSPNGCGILRSSDTIIAYPNRVITITPGSHFTVCPDTYQSLTLYSNGGAGIGLSTIYHWYKNGTLLTGSTSSSYSITDANPAGAYYVEVTDVNGCIARSQDVIVEEDCPPSTVCTPSPSLTLTGSWAECDKLNAQYVFSGGTITNVEWLGSDFLSLSSASGNGAYFTSYIPGDPIIPGVHLIAVKITYQTSGGTCVISKTVAITKNYVPDFNTTTTCNSGTNLTYNVTLHNNSTVFSTQSLPLTYTFSGTGISPPQTGETIVLSNLAPGTYNYTLMISTPGKPNCTITKTLVLGALPNLNFTLADVNYCSQEPIVLTIPNYNAAINYSWHFAGNVYNASNATTVVTINSNGQFPITLQATTPLGCTISSNPIMVNVSNQLFNGTLVADPSVVCTGTPPVITYTSGTGGATPISYIWMNGTLAVATTFVPTYSPTATGTYWVKLIGATGCSYAGAGNASVTIIPGPYVGITGNSSICQGDTTILQGNVLSNNLERRWSLNGTPLPSPFGTWTAATAANLTYTVPATLTPATYNYMLEIRYATGNGCTSNAVIPVTVFAATAPPVLSYTVTSCQPYKVQVSVTNPVTGGIYNWSNGATGQTIQVTTGGAFAVSYTGPSGGCDATASITVPHPFAWDFPGGFYTICLNAVPAPYILGPLGTYDSYQWLVNNQVTIQGTNTNVQNQPINQIGNYQLLVSDEGCNYQSEVITIAPNLQSCSYPKCEVSFTVNSITYSNGQYHLNGSVANNNNFPVTVTIISFNNYGTYSPSSISIGANATVSFTSLNFTPNTTFNGGADFVIVQMAGCYSAIAITFPPINPGITARVGAPLQAAVMQIAPNPAEQFTTVSYDLGTEYTQAETLTLYSLLGVPLMTQNLKQLSGQVELNTATLPSGTYIVSIQANGKRALQQMLIKK